MPNNVKFRIVGTYFGSISNGAATGEIAVDVPQDNPSVYQVMLAVVQKVKAGNVNGVTSFTFDPPVPAASDMLNSLTIDYSTGPSNGCPPGLYYLYESFSNPQYYLQYYIYDQDFKQLNVDSTFHPFGTPPPIPIGDNYTVIWRLVGVLVEPNGSNRIKSMLKKDSETLRAI